MMSGELELMRRTPFAGRDQGLKQWASELFNIPATNVVQGPAGGSVAGFQYTFPPLSTLWPVRQIKAYTSTDLTFTVVPDGVPQTTPALNKMAKWTLTLREPDGTFIINNAPLTMFAPNPSGQGNLWPRYFDTRQIPDPRMSYLQCMADTELVNVVLEFIYR